ncbi:MAG: signal peptidase II [Alphaproteobacteria bacterium]|nr:signal peptidase II [Alphaproteobacteria bacterium]
MDARLTKLLVIAAVVLLLDQSTKWLVVQWMDLKNLGYIAVYPPYVNFSIAWNQGVNFGLFANGTEIMRWVLVVLSLGISVWLINWARKLTSPIGVFWAALVVGGAIGNALDRVIYGAVADFLNVACCGLKNPYAFNIADVVIFLGAFGLVLTSNKLDNEG